jgi:hypothetical protein
MGTGHTYITARRNSTAVNTRSLSCTVVLGTPHHVRAPSAMLCGLLGMATKPWALHGGREVTRPMPPPWGVAGAGVERLITLLRCLGTARPVWLCAAPLGVAASIRALLSTLVYELRATHGCRHALLRPVDGGDGGDKVQHERDAASTVRGT